MQPSTRSSPTTESEHYDMREVVKRVVDGHSLLLLSEDYASNIITAFARLNGRVIGVVANDPRHLAGVSTRTPRRSR